MGLVKGGRSKREKWQFRVKEKNLDDLIYCYNKITNREEKVDF